MYVMLLHDLYKLTRLSAVLSLLKCSAILCFQPIVSCCADEVVFDFRTVQKQDN